MNIYTLLTSLPSVTTLAQHRISPVLLNAPQDAPAVNYPAISYLVVAATQDASLTTAGRTRLRVEMNCWSPRVGGSYTEADELRTALLDSLAGFSGQLGDTFIQNVELVDMSDYFEEEVQMYRCQIEFYILF